MKIVFLLIVAISFTHIANGQAGTGGQVTDTELIKGLLGKPYSSVNPRLDSMQVWYYYHVDVDKAAKGKDQPKKVYSIATSGGAVKVYSLFVNDKNVIDEIIINFRHDDKQHVEDYKKMGKATESHIGVYSTDLTFKRK